MKRLFDIAFSGITLFFLALPFLVIMLILRFTGERLVWYHQERIGYLGQHFKVLKFVTMRCDSEHTGTKDITLRNDSRVLPVGRLLRMTKINELPQFINVFKGDMSIVGWRPLTPRAFNCYSQSTQEQIVRCMPGLTGIGSIVFRDEEGVISKINKPAEQAYREDIAPYKGDLELWYQKHQSFRLDLEIIALTAWTVFCRKSRLWETRFKGLPPRPAIITQGHTPAEAPDRPPSFPAPAVPPSQAVAALIAAIREVVGPGSVLLHGPCLEGNAALYLQRCVDTRWVSTSGSYVIQFERMLAKFTGAKHAIATINGTSALHASLLLLGISAGDEVLCPSLTFVATANAISYCGATPHFCDVEARTMGLDPSKLEDYLKRIAHVKDGSCFNAKTGKRIAALLVMHTMGHPPDMDGLMAVAERWGLTLVEDAAAALGSTYHGRHAGLFGKMGALSFNSNKIVTTGGGGAILTDDDRLAERAHHLTTTGKLPHTWEFVHDMVAYNYRMPNINAALGCAQMEQLPTLLARKRKLAQRYIDALSRLDDVHIMTEPQGCQSNYWLNAVAFRHADVEMRDQLLRAANDAGLQSRPIWRPMHQLQMYATCPRMDMTVTEDLAARVVNIPSGPAIIVA